MVFEHYSSTTIESHRCQKAVQLTLCSEKIQHVVGSQGLVVGIVGFALEVRAESRAQYNCFTCPPLLVEVRCLIFIRCSLFPTHGEDVDVASVVCCHFRQVCASVNRRVFVIVILCVACLFTWFYTKVSTIQRNNRCSSTHCFDLCFD